MEELEMISCEDEFLPKTVGQEFMDWAERCWLIDKILSTEPKNEFDKEHFKYEYIREIFVGKIDNIIKERLNLFS